MVGDNRKCLGVLQPHNQKQSKLVLNGGTLNFSKGKNRRSDENICSVKSLQPDGIYRDPLRNLKKAKSFASIGVQTDSASGSEAIVPPKTEANAAPQKIEDTVNVSTGDTAAAEYWENVAEERRKALDESLQENYELHAENKILLLENKTLQEDVLKLKRENKLLEDISSEAKDLALLVESLTADP